MRPCTIGASGMALYAFLAASLADPLRSRWGGQSFLSTVSACPCRVSFSMLLYFLPSPQLDNEWSSWQSCSRISMQTVTAHQVQQVRGPCASAPGIKQPSTHPATKNGEDNVRKTIAFSLYKFFIFCASAMLAPGSNELTWNAHCFYRWLRQRRPPGSRA